MQIERLLLQRFCQHTNRTIDFSPGLNVILGPIGSGKSNILKAIRLAFTNSSGNSGIREADIQYGSDDSMKSGIHLVGNYDSRRFFISRNLSPASREFYWEGSSVKLRAEKAISDEIYNTMGIDTSLFDEFIVVPQGELSSILSMTEGDRAELMQKLVGLQKYTKLHTWLGTYLNKNPIITNYENPEVVQSALEAAVAQRAKYASDLNSLSLPDSAQIEEAKAVVANYALAKDVRSKLAVKQASLQNNLAQLPLAESAQSSIEVSKTQHEAQLAEKQIELSKLAALEIQAFKYESLIQWNQRLTQLKQQLVLPTPPAEYSAKEAGLEAQFNEASGKLVLMQRFKLLLDGGHRVCPTCLREVTADFSDAVAEMPAQEQKCKALQRVLALSRDYDLELARCTKQKAAAEAAMPEVEAKLLELGEVAPANMSSAVLSVAKNNLSSAIAQLQKKVNDANAAAASAATFLAGFRNTIAVEKEEVASLTAQSTTLSNISDEQFTDAGHLLSMVSAIQNSQASLQGCIAVIDNQLPALQARLTKAEAEKSNAEKVISFRASVEAARDLLHQKKLPFELAKNGMLALASHMNDVLEAFNADYRVSAGVGSSFQATFFNSQQKGKQSDSRLSGGEGAQFGLALVIASHTNWAQGLGFLALDEPTYGFGQGDMRCVQIAIEHLRKLSNEQGIQVIVVTHEKSLVPLFDNVITLEG